MSSKFISYYLLYFFIFTILVKSSNSTVLIKAGNKVNYSCEKNIYTISIDVIFSEKPKQEIFPFTLNLGAPDDLNFKESNKLP